MFHNSLRSDKWHMSSNALSGEPRGSQLPSPRRSVPQALPALCTGGMLEMRLPVSFSKLSVLSFLRIRESVCRTQAVHAKFLSAQGLTS